MRILMLGGSPANLGGVEAFCDRFRIAVRRQCNWDVVHAPTDTSYLTLKKVPSVLRRLWRLARRSRREVDCVWLQYVCLPDLAYLLVAKLRGFTVMVTPHLGSNWRSQSNPLLRALSGALLALADRLALISPTQELEVNLPKRIPRSQIRNFLPESFLQGCPPNPNPADQPMHLIHSGRLSEGKGTFLFLDVCRSLKGLGTQFQAKITGGADEATYQRVRERIASYHLEDCVQLLGRVSEENLLKLLQGSDVLIHLSTIDSYPLIVLESIACSTFPICINLAGATDMVSSYTGHVVTPDNPVAESVAFLAELPLSDLRAMSSAAACKVRSDYAWSRSVGALQTAIRETVETNPLSV